MNKEYLKKRTDFSRKRTGVREDSKRIIILCEGEKTEKFYFTKMKESLKLHLVRPISVLKASNTDCWSIAIEGIKYANDETVDEVWCVFDKDNNEENFRRAIIELRKQEKETRKRIVPIYSIISFEYWLILHYKKTRKSFVSAKECLEELKKYISDYAKKDEDIYYKVLGMQEIAIKNAKEVKEEWKKDIASIEEQNSSTEVYLLVERLIEESQKSSY